MSERPKYQAQIEERIKDYPFLVKCVFGFSVL